MTMNRRIDLVGSLLIAALGVGVLAYGWTYPQPRIQYDLFGPMGVPMVLGAGLLIGGIAQSLRTVALLRTFGPHGAPEGTEDEPGFPASGSRGLAFLAGSFVYIAALEPLGYLIATPITLGVALYALHFRTWWKLGLAAVGFTLVGFAVFSSLLSVPVPVGILNDLLVSLGLIERVR